VHTQYGKLKVASSRELELLELDVRQFVRLLRVTVYDYYKMEMLEDTFP